MAAIRAERKRLISLPIVPARTVGVNTLQYVASDAAGNSATSTRTVYVVDTTAPVVTLNGSSPMTVECHGSFSDLGATANDDCAGSLSVSVSGSSLINNASPWVGGGAANEDSATLVIGNSTLSGNLTTLTSLGGARTTIAGSTAR